LTVFVRSEYDRTVQISRLLAVVVVLGAVGTASPAYALDESSARLHFEKATDAFTRGRYDDAVREYLLAYRASNDSSLLFNVAQSHRLAGHYSSALQYYRMYLQNTPEAQDRKEVEKQIREMEKKLGGEQSTRLPPPEKLAPPPLKPVTPPQPEPPVTPPPTVTPTPAPPEATGPHTIVESPYAGRVKIIAGGVTLGVGVALVATGIAFGALAQKAGDDLTAANHAGLPFDPNKQSDGKTDTIVEGVCLGIGAAAAVAGAVVLGLGFTEKRAARVAVVPVITPTGAAASMSVRF
jgi:hypothetical protein